MYNPIPDISCFLPVCLFFLGGAISYVLCYTDRVQSWRKGFNDGIEQTLKVVNDDKIGDNEMTLNELVKECRAKRKLTISKLSEDSGVGRNTIMNIEYGRTNSRFDTFQLLFDAMGYELTVIEKRNIHGKPEDKSRCR